MNDNFGIKDIYYGALRALRPMTIGGVNFAKGEAILHFSEIQEIVLSEDSTKNTAKGGYLNQPLVQWETHHGVQGAINLGTISKFGLGIVNKTELMNNNESIAINQIEICTTDGNGMVELKKVPIIGGPFSVYFYNNGAIGSKILDYTLTNSTLIIEPEQTILVDYYYNYSDSTSSLNIGRKDINGFLGFDGKFYYTDEFTGVRKTGVIEIPQLIIESDFSIRLGRNINPLITVLRFTASPVGERGSGSSVKITFLNEDVDSDI